MFFFFYMLTILSSIFMLICTNPINSVLFLISIFISVAMIFLMWNIEFLALIFIIIYVGAIAVLFLFIIMMINIKGIEKDNTTYLTIGVMVVLLFAFQFLFFIFFSTNEIKNVYFFSDYFYYMQMNNLDEAVRLNVLRDLGIILYYIRPFLVLLVASILLIAMIGTIYLTNVKRGFSMKKQFNQLSRGSGIKIAHIINNE
jgi:NADH-quinone oxidoreductase subunit J